MEPRALCDAEIDAVAGGALPALFGSNNTINFLSGNGGISGPSISINILGVNQYSSASSGSANGAAGGSGSIVNSGATLLGLLRHTFH
jgi:hypothetical protein